jgi:hypothetical protein
MVGRMTGRAAPAFGRFALAPPSLPLAAGADAFTRGQDGRISPARRPTTDGNERPSGHFGLRRRPPPFRPSGHRQWRHWWCWIRYVRIRPRYPWRRRPAQSHHHGGSVGCRQARVIGLFLPDIAIFGGSRGPWGSVSRNSLGILGFRCIGPGTRGSWVTGSRGSSRLLPVSVGQRTQCVTH